MGKSLTGAGLQLAAHSLRTGIAEVRTLAAVESNGQGFLDDGRVTIRFEPHIFHLRTAGRYDVTYPHLSYKEWNPKIPKNTEHSYQLFNQACTLNATAAVLSSSWGMFQVMGFNFASCGCNNLKQFVTLMEKSEDSQLERTVIYLLTTGLDDELREHRWEDLARLYNGKQYKRNQYDTKLAAAYERFAAMPTITLLNP
ncbi:N-acetylmuramidase family protein [Spirosoma aureum]|uniref:N-acetylmuramidase family protein n=1 Tax=Spirosoma aureum TaxID=2692134 RepID=A0A6G9ATM0_9BACT|nr:N-acetylmuramidase family protein [Spirosoma aureum]QIP15694.1 N-acetylmuramidase family protein [Spirosoma aureum]